MPNEINTTSCGRTVLEKPMHLKEADEVANSLLQVDISRAISLYMHCYTFHYALTYTNYYMPSTRQLKLVSIELEL